MHTNMSKPTSNLYDIDVSYAIYDWILNNELKFDVSAVEGRTSVFLTVNATRDQLSLFLTAAFQRQTKRFDMN